MGGESADVLTRAAAWAMTFWLAAMTAWYIWAAVNAVRHPLNLGDDAKWAHGWLAYAGAALLSHAFLPRRIATAFWGSALALVAAAMILASGGLLPALACLWIVVLAGFLGARLLRLLGASPSTVPFEWSSVAIGAGLALLSLAALALGIARALSPAGVVLLCAALTALEGRALWKNARRLPGLAASGLRELSSEQGLVLTLSGFVGLINLAWALAPEIQFDALNYHLAVPRDFLEAHRVMDLPHYFHSYFAQMMDVFFTLCLALGGQIAAKLLMFALGIVAALAVFALGRALFNARVGLWAGALFYATPMTTWLSSTTYIELALAFYLFTALLAFLRWRRTRENGWLWTSGLLAGAVLGVKATGIYGLPVLGLVLLWDLIRMRGVSPFARIRTLAGFLAAASLSAFPWYLLRYAFTGNPFFPLLNAVFRARPVPIGFLVTNITGAGYGLETSPLDLLRVPFLATFQTNNFGEPFAAGALGLALVLLFPLGILLDRRRSGVAVALTVCAGYLAAWALVSLGVRYYYAILPLVAALGVATVDALSPAGWRRKLHFGLLGAVLLAQVAVIPVQFWNISDRIPLLRAFGRETSEQFLSRALPAYPAVEFLNREARPGEKVVGYGVDNIRFYVRPRLDTVIEAWDLQREIRRARITGMKGERLASNLVRMGYRHVLVYEMQPTRHPLFRVLLNFLDDFTTLEFNRQGGRVYRLEARPEPAGGENLLENPGFETLDAADRARRWVPLGRAEARVARGPGQVHAGDSALLLPAEQSVAQVVAVPGAGGRLCTLGQFLRGEGSAAFVLRADWFNARGELLESRREEIPVSSQWSWRPMTLAAPEGAISIRIFLGAHGEGRVWVDDVFFAVGAPARPAGK